ncbi:MAG: M61 family peptidase, partial [Bacteroidota bacterium]
IIFLSALILLPLIVRAEGTITLAVDARDSPRNILHARETLSVKPGPLTLFYPKWIPGEHGPTGPVADLVGLKITANGVPVRWRRDLVEMYALHCEVPRGTAALELSYDFILPPTRIGYSSAASSTPGLLMLSWNQVVLYPENEKPADISVTASLKLHEGWKFGTALEVESDKSGEIRFAPVSLNTLIDSPVLSGVHFKRVDISGDQTVPYHIDMVSDDESALAMPDRLVERYRNLVVQANSLFGAHHFQHYDFLYTLSDQVAHFGLEHHQCSDDRVDERTIIDSGLQLAHAGLLPHEFVHSWNGKFRRPTGLATGNYSTPMKDDMLWVYEGLTEYLGNVLTARSGLRTPEEYRENLALVAAGLDNRPGREWRPLQDAADEASVLYDSRADWASLRRGVDFYDEGDLIWLEADVLIRNLTAGKKSLDDFCKLFHGGPSTGPLLKPYTFDDVVSAMNQVAPYDWRTFFQSRLESLSPHAPLGGIEMGGWKLTYVDTMSEMESVLEKARKTIDMRFSLGTQIGENGELRDVIVGSPAAAAGLIPTMRLISVDGKTYSPEALHDAVKEARGVTSPIRIVASQGEYVMSFAVDYHGGERYPVLERVGSKPDVLDQIIRPLTGK